MNTKYFSQDYEAQDETAVGALPAAFLDESDSLIATGEAKVWPARNRIDFYPDPLYEAVIEGSRPAFVRFEPHGQHYPVAKVQSQACFYKGRPMRHYEVTLSEPVAEGVFGAI